MTSTHQTVFNDTSILPLEQSTPLLVIWGETGSYLLGDGLSVRCRVLRSDLFGESVYLSPNTIGYFEKVPLYLDKEPEQVCGTLAVPRSPYLTIFVFNNFSLRTDFNNRKNAEHQI